nr:uncharacterized protein LOC109168150 [Ipomoea batatas]
MSLPYTSPHAQESAPCAHRRYSMAGSSSRQSKRLRRSSSGVGPGNTDEGNQNGMVDSPSSDDFVSPPVVLPPCAQPNSPVDDSDDGLGREDVDLYPSMKIRGSPK